jgi:HK97 family phage major capsid protein
MATRTTAAGANFPAELVAEMFSAVQGHSALAKLSGGRPIPFNGETTMVFSMNGEASIVGEGANKPAGDASVAPKVIKPVKFVYQHRVSDEFVYASEEGRQNYLQTFADGFAKKIARGLDIAAMHGINPADLANASFKATNSFDGEVTNTVTYAAANVDANIDAAIAMIRANDREVTGLALSPTAGSALAAIKVNGVAQYPEFRFGQNPNAFYGMGSDVNSTVSVTGTAAGSETDHVIVGDFANAFKWGYAKNIPLEVIAYGDPDGLGDLKRTNEVVLRAEAYIGWGILDPASFARVKA